jgi:hypothetical protein
MKIALAATVVMVEAGIATGTSADQAPHAGPVECRIETRTADGFLRIQAIGRAEALTSGRYQFAINKSDAAGSTTNQQSGDFSLAPGQDVALATVMLEATADGHYSARLMLNWRDGGVSCHSP